jgi:hypothetical protein
MQIERAPAPLQCLAHRPFEIITAANPLPDDLRQALDTINRPN